MASCELDYRLSSNSESMDYEDGDSSDDEARLSIVEANETLHQTGAMSRTFIRSLSTGDGCYSGSTVGGAAHNASDAVESLLLLGQRPVFSGEHQVAPLSGGDSSGTCSDPGTSSGGVSPPFSRFSSTNQVEQRMMVNYYQKMRERNNEASKRCRLKRRIKQDSLDKTRILLESHREALSHRVAKLHKIKNILNEACRNVGQEEGQCDCQNVCNLIKAANREMPDLLDLTNSALLRKSKKVRDTNMEEVLGAEAQSRLSDLRPLKRGPRKQDDTAARLLVDTLAPSSPSGALDLSSSAKSGVNLSSVKREIPTEDKKFNQVTFASKGYVPLAPKAASLPQIPVRKIIVDNPSLPRISSPILPLFSPGVQVSPSKSTISLPSFNGTNTIILTPLGQPGLPSTIFSLPSSCSSSSSSPTTPSSSSSTLLSLASFTLPPTKQEETVVIKSEPDLTIVAMDDGEQVQVKQEATERDPTTTCCAANSNMGTCSQELIDLNSLTQMLDLVTMEPKIAGELTAAEKYIIKSRLRIEFWKAEETPSFICSAHRRSIVHSQGPQACSVCAKRKSKKFDMYFITYRMAVEFYMTAGKFLAIGRLACSNCKAKSLKGLDFSNSYLVPDYGHPLEQGKEDDDAIRKGMEEEEEEEKKRTEKREVILQPIPSTQGKLATIQPLPPRPQALPLLPPTLSLTPSPINTESSTQKIQKLHSALAAVNPGYRPPGFTITSLSECSEGVLQDAIRATQVAVSTLLSAIAPGQEASLWHHVKPSMDHCLLKEGTQQGTHTPMNQ